MVNFIYCKAKIFIACVFFFVAKQSFANARLARTVKYCRFERSDPTGCKAQAAAKKPIEFKIHLWIYGYFATLSMTKINRYDKDFVILSLLQKAKNPYFKMQICTLNLWILRCTQYDNVNSL